VYMDLDPGQPELTPVVRRRAVALGTDSAAVGVAA
jgi:hypothetical protein